MKARFISYLDLMCCGFGGAVLMFLITAAADEPRAPTSDLIFIRCHHELNSNNPRAEVAIEYQPPGSQQWQRVAVKDPQLSNGVFSFFSAAPKQNSGSEAVMVLRSPTSGEWKFRAYLVNYPQLDENQSKEPDVKPCLLRFEIKGSHTDLSDINTFELAQPGQAGPAFSVKFSR